MADAAYNKSMEVEPNKKDVVLDPVGSRDLRHMPFSMRQALQAMDPIARGRAVSNWYRDRRLESIRRREERVRRQLEDDTRGAATFSIIGKWAVNVAAQTEPDTYVRRVRRSQLMRKWQEFTRKAFNRPAI